MAETQGRFHRSKNIGDSKSSLWSILVCLSVAVMLILVVGACAEPTPTVDVAQYVDATLTSVAATSEAAVPTPTPTVNPYELIPPRGEYNHTLLITEEYDKFDDVTDVVLGEDELSTVTYYNGMRNLIVSYSYEGTTPTIPSVVAWAVYGVSDTQEFEGCSKIQFLLDDTVRIEPFLDEGYFGSALNTLDFLEAVTVVLKGEDFLRIVNADKVDMRVCTEDFTLSENQMEALRDLASRMQ